MHEDKALIDQIRYLFSDFDSAERVIKEQLQPLRLMVQNWQLGRERALLDSEDILQSIMKYELLSAAREGLSKVKRGWELNQRDRTGLEALIDEALPFLVVTNGSFNLPVDWNWLKSKQKNMEKLMPSVGRIRHISDEAYRGTGFVVGEDIVMTNWHVINSLTYYDDDTWHFLRHSKILIDFGVEYPVESGKCLQCTKLLYKHPYYDLALLKIETNDSIPPSLIISSEEPNSLNGRAIYVIGHPFYDTRYGAKLEAQWLLFRMWENLGFKHLALGYADALMYYQPDLSLGLPEKIHLSHRVSTLPGNSGSCVVDVESHDIIGLHCAGDNQNKINYAVPLWELSGDMNLRKHGVNFR